MQHPAGMRGNTRSSSRETTEPGSPRIYHLTSSNPRCFREMNHSCGASEDHPELDPKAWMPPLQPVKPGPMDIERSTIFRESSELFSRQARIRCQHNLLRRGYSEVDR